MENYDGIKCHVNNIELCSYVPQSLSHNCQVVLSTCILYYYYKWGFLTKVFGDSLPTHLGCALTKKNFSFKKN